MRLIKPSVEEWKFESNLDSIWKHIARCARVCYQSEPRNIDESPFDFIKRVILRNYTFDEIAKSRKIQLKLHLSVLEHGAIYFTCCPTKAYTVEKKTKKKMIEFFPTNKFSKVKIVGDTYYISTNMRVIVENGLLDTLVFMTKPCEHHDVRHSFSIIDDIGCIRDFNRHRCHGISEESTRFCDYTKSKFKGELTFVMPEWLDLEEKHYGMEDYKAMDFKDLTPKELYINRLLETEKYYQAFREKEWTPQMARIILDLSLKAQTIHSAYESDWKEFLLLRDDAISGNVHPNVKVIAQGIAQLLNKTKQK